MRYFDLHCDTATQMLSAGKTLIQNGLDVDLDKLNGIDRYTQIFAVFIPDELRGKAAAAYFDDVCVYFSEQIKQCEQASFYGTDDTPVRAIISVEGGSACGGSIDGIYHLHDCGTAVMTLTWNTDNEIASGCFSPEDRGITPFGHDALRAMKKCGIVPDVSHLGKKSFSELADFYDDVFIATHSDYDITENIYGKARNLQDWQAREIIDRKGLIGINFCADFLGDHGDTGFSAVLRHIDRFLSMGAENVLAIGSDYDGCTLHPSLKGLDKIPLLYRFLSENHLEDSILDKIFFENADAFFRKRVRGLYGNT